MGHPPRASLFGASPTSTSPCPAKRRHHPAAACWSPPCRMPPAPVLVNSQTASTHTQCFQALRRLPCFLGRLLVWRHPTSGSLYTTRGVVQSQNRMHMLKPSRCGGLLCAWLEAVAGHHIQRHWICGRWRNEKIGNEAGRRPPGGWLAQTVASQKRRALETGSAMTCVRKGAWHVWGKGRGRVEGSWDTRQGTAGGTRDKEWQATEVARRWCLWLGGPRRAPRRSGRGAAGAGGQGRARCCNAGCRRVLIRCAHEGMVSTGCRRAVGGHGL